MLVDIFTAPSLSRIPTITL